MILVQVSQVQLVQVLKTYIPEVPSEVSAAEILSALTIDFIAHCSKIPLKKLLLKMYRDLTRHLWGAFKGLLPSSERNDITFDLYLDRSTKEGECNGSSQDVVVDSAILQSKQSLPVKMEKFGGSSSNKMQLEQIFIEWIIKSYKG